MIDKEFENLVKKAKKMEWKKGAVIVLSSVAVVIILALFSLGIWQKTTNRGLFYQKDTVSGLQMNRIRSKEDVNGFMRLVLDNGAAYELNAKGKSFRFMLEQWSNGECIDKEKIAEISAIDEQNSQFSGAFYWGIQGSKLKIHFESVAKGSYTTEYDLKDLKKGFSTSASGIGNVEEKLEKNEKYTLATWTSGDKLGSKAKSLKEESRGVENYIVFYFLIQ